MVARSLVALGYNSFDRWFVRRLSASRPYDRSIWPLGWTQAQTGEMLEPFLGIRLNQAGVSAIEKTFDSHRRRNIDVSEVVAFARCFGRPVGWFFMPPPGTGDEIVEPVAGEKLKNDLKAADLATVVLGTAEGWDLLAQRVLELAASGFPAAHDTMRNLAGSADTKAVADDLERRRQTVQAASIDRLASPTDDVITGMARLLVELVRTTPAGMARLRDADPDEALELLARGDEAGDKVPGRATRSTRR
jgi:hypothetical protein